MKKLYAVAGLAIALASCSTISSTVTTANVQTACGWVQTADIVFNTLAPLSGGKITADMIATEKKADASATVICTPPYPTDVQTALADLLKIVGRIQTVTPAS
jgi:hypothetical protein